MAITAEQEQRVRRAQKLYDEQLRDKLEITHRGWIVAIDPDSGEYFLGRTLEEASAAFEKVYPDRWSYALRIGFPGVYEVGCSL